jgi:hypothetical protein
MQSLVLVSHESCQSVPKLPIWCLESLFVCCSAGTSACFALLQFDCPHNYYNTTNWPIQFHENYRISDWTNQGIIGQLPQIGPIGWHLQPNRPIRRMDQHRVTEQFPLCIAYAITVYCLGLTLQQAVVNLVSKVFAPRLSYIAIP